MEQWEIDFNWLKIQHFVKSKFKTDSLPKLDTVLFIIGVQELGVIRDNLTHEEKLGITTLGTITVLSREKYFEKKSIDEDGWPIYNQLKPYNPLSETERQNQLKVLINRYFNDNFEPSEFQDI